MFTGLVEEQGAVEGIESMGDSVRLRLRGPRVTSDAAHGDSIAVNGPLYVRSEGGSVQLGFRVEARHTNPMRICHGGMMASFCDMLLPISIHRKSQEIGFRFLPTINLQIDYLAPARLGAWVQGEADPLKATR
jgi:uncharacterized protein (TIGR00369 family)